jgi:uncharacterized membrane protein
MEMHGIVPLIVPAHIVAGMLALVFGYIALFARKGATLHRKSGMFFVFAMVTMSLSGALMEALTKSLTSVNVVAGLLTFYFVATALLTVRRRPQGFSWIDRAAVLLALTVSVLAFIAGFDLVGRGRPEAAPSFIFGVVGLLAATGDIRMMRAGGLQGARRISRHLWRMCFAMWVAAASFFWGPPGRVPEIIYYPALLPIPVLLPIAVMVYWLWRIRIRKTVRGRTSLASSELRPGRLESLASGELRLGKDVRVSAPHATASS